MYFQPYGDEQQLNLNWIINEIINLHKQLDPDYETPSFDQIYPYSNLNRLNLDWVLSELKALKELAPEPPEPPEPPDLSSDDISNESSAPGTTVTNALNSIIDTIKQNYPLSIFRIGRLLDAPYLTGNSNVLYGQAMCFYDNKYYVVGSYNSNANQSITVWNNTGVLQNSAQFTILGHCNGICATDDYLLIAEGTSNNIHIIDRNTLAYVRTVSNINGIDNVTGISNDNNTIYFFGYTTGGNGARTIFTLDLSNDSYTQVALFPNLGGGSPQNFCVHDGYAYFLYVQGNNIFKFNLNTSVIEKIYDIPDGDGFNPCGECESLFYKDGDIYLHSELYYRDTYTRTYNVGISEIYKTDLLNPIQNTLAISYMKPETVIELTVNQSMAYTFNPYLTYSTIEEACHILNYLKYGMIIAQNTTAHGAIKLIGGIYSVRASGNAYVDEMHIINSFLEVSQIAVSTYSYIRNSSYRGCAGSFGGTLEIWRTKFEITRFSMAGVNTVKLNRSTLCLNYITNAIPGAATFSATETIANMVEIKDTYKQYCLRPILATASGSSTIVIITIASSLFCGIVLLTSNELVSGKTITMGNDTIVFTNDFKITVNDTELSSTDIITATAIRRG